MSKLYRSPNKPQSSKLLPSLVYQIGEIDLRREFHNLLYGTAVQPMRGHWIVYRRYDLTQTSEFWDEVYRSGVDGPAYKYIDIPILTRRDPRYQPDMAESSTNIGFLPGGQYVYYFEWDVIPSRIDQIFEINWNDNSIAPHLDEIQTPYVDKFNIKEVFPHRGDDGQPAFWTCFVNLDRINY